MDYSPKPLLRTRLHLLLFMFPFSVRRLLPSFVIGIPILSVSKGIVRTPCKEGHGNYTIVRHLQFRITGYLLMKNCMKDYLRMLQIGVRDISPFSYERLLELTLNKDIDEYLPPRTLQWCEQTLKRLGYRPDNENDKPIPYDRGSPHREIYLTLRTEVSGHIERGEEPILTKTVHPLGSWHGNLKPRSSDILMIWI